MRVSFLSLTAWLPHLGEGGMRVSFLSLTAWLPHLGEGGMRVSFLSLNSLVAPSWGGWDEGIFSFS